MQVPFVYGANDLRLCEVARPHAGVRDVVVRVYSVGICGSDLGYIACGGIGGPSAAPMPLGHELCGVVDERGSAVTSVEVGDRVILNPLVNMIGNGGPEGGFAEYLLVRDVASDPGSLLRVPDSLSFDVGALVEPLAVAQHGINRLGARPGAAVAIFGAGPIGLGAIVALRKRGVEDIVVFELSEYRRNRALQLGARAALDPSKTSPERALHELHGTTQVFQVDVPKTTHYLEASGAPVLADIVGFARGGATICVLSVQKKPVPIDFQRVLARELTITAALGYPRELVDVLELLKSEPIDFKPLVSHRFSAGEIMQAFDTARRPDLAAKVLVQYHV
jgi:(R,R)-butanediol dehydrogenase/meso-butanediol dehydrogenase/diacetyl reductase